MKLEDFGEEVRAMSPEEQRVGIAEWEGWQRTRPYLPGIRGHGWIDPNGSLHEQDKPWPKYLNDLNAMHEAILRVYADPDATLGQRFESSLRMVTLRDAPDAPTDRGLYHRIIVATAAQQAEALCRTIYPERWI